MSANIEIRLAQKADVNDILKIYAPFVLNTAISFEEEVPAPEEFWQRIENVLEKAPWMVCKIDGELAGYGYAGDHRSRAAYRWNRELSVYVDEKFRRRNIALALYTTIVEILKLQGFTNILAGITLPNPVSVSFHEAFGFKKIGEYHGVGYKFGKKSDTGWWEMPIQDEDFIPGDILSMEHLSGSKSWEEAIQLGSGLIKL